MPKKPDGKRKSCYEQIEIRNFKKLYAQNTIGVKKECSQHIENIKGEVRK